MPIRQAEKRDAHAIASFIAMAEGEMAQFFTGTADPETSAEVLAGFILSPAPNRYSLEHNLVAEEDGKAVASMMFFPADSQPELDVPLLEALRARGLEFEKLFFEGEPGTFYLSTMGVDPAYRGRGLGTALLRAAFDLAGKKGFKRVSLLVAKDKPKAKALYERLGFGTVADVRMGGFDYHRMIRDV